MNSETNSIPNLEVKSSGDKKNRFEFITGFVELPCWDGYFLDESTVSSKTEKRITGGRISLEVEGDIRPNGSINLSKQQVNAYTYIVANQETIKHNILEHLVANFNELDPHGEHLSFDQESGYPRPSQLIRGFDFRDYIGPSSIFIMDIEKDDAAYTTWHFECRWDVEHGFQIILHKDRIIDMGQEADIYKVYKNNGTYEQELADYKPAKTPPPFAWKKKWWQFWKNY